MLLIPEKRVVFYTPPKCSSTTVIDVLTNQGNARIEYGPQGPWRDGVDFLDCVGKHTLIVPYHVRHYKKYIFYRNPFDRFVSLWRHYCKYSMKEISFEEFVDISEHIRSDRNMWFYTWRMCDIINESPKDCGIIQHNDLGMINKILGTEYSFPVLNNSAHDAWYTYYTPELYRRVYDLA